MKTITLKFAASSLLLAVLSACGGGSSSAVDQPTVAATPSAVTAAPVATTAAPDAVAPAAPTVARPLDKYVGVWKSDCSQAARTTFTITNPRNDGTLDVSTRDDVHDKFGCLGAIIATVTPNPNAATIAFLDAVPTAPMRNQFGQILNGAVDRTTISHPAFTNVFTGPGSVRLNANNWTIPLDDGNTMSFGIQYPAASTSGGFALLNKDMYVLRAFDTTTNAYPITLRAVRSK